MTDLTQWQTDGPPTPEQVPDDDPVWCWLSDNRCVFMNAWAVRNGEPTPEVIAWCLHATRPEPYVATPDPGEGWELLPHDAIRRLGDEWKRKDGTKDWTPINDFMAGQPIMDNGLWYRRRIKRTDLADRIVDALLTMGGTGERGDNLGVCLSDKNYHRLGGWCRDAAIAKVREVLDTAPNIDELIAAVHETIAFLRHLGTNAASLADLLEKHLDTWAAETISRP